MKALGIFRVKIHKTTDNKKLKEGSKAYDYGTINIRSQELAKYVGKIVKVRVEKEE